MEKQEYTIKETSEILGISVSAVQRRIKGNVLESYKDGGRVVVVMNDEEIRKLKKNESSKKPSPKKEKVPSGASNTKIDKETTDNNSDEFLQAIHKLTKEVERLSAEIKVCKQDIKEINNRNLWWWLIKR